MKPKNDSENPLFSQLGAFQSIDTEGDWNKLRQNIGFENEGNHKKGSLSANEDHRNGSLFKFWWTAAAVILLLGIGFLSKQYVFSSQEMIIALAGEASKEVQLPDGSLVTLNSMSEISYPEKFRKGKREVLLSGEAFFKVERNLKKPFTVHIEEKAMVEVLGTSFNIRSGEAISVLVLEGRVAFSDAEEKLTPLILGKDEQATLSNGILYQEEIVNLNMLSWKTGILYFDQSFIGDVVNQIESFYNRKIILEEGIPDNLKFTSTIDNQDLESVLDELSLVLGLAISFENGHILISKSP